MHAAVAQSVERRLGKAEVGGSIPLGSLNNFNKENLRNGLKSLFGVFLYLFFTKQRIFNCQIIPYLSL